MKLIILFGLLAYSIIGLSQSIIWQNTLGGTGSDELFSIIPLENIELILTGYSNSDSIGDKNENYPSALQNEVEIMC